MCAIYVLRCFVFECTSQNTIEWPKFIKNAEEIGKVKVFAVTYFYQLRYQF